MTGPELFSPALVGHLLLVIGVGVIALLVGIRLGARTRIEPQASDEEQLAAALGVLRRHLERKALADIRPRGWSCGRPIRIAWLNSATMLSR